MEYKDKRRISHRNRGWRWVVEWGILTLERIFLISGWDFLGLM